MRREDVTKEIADYISDSFKQYTQKMKWTLAIPLICDDVKKKYGVNVHLTTVDYFSHHDYDTILIQRELKSKKISKGRPLPSCMQKYEKMKPRIYEKNLDLDEFNYSLKSIENGVVPFLKTDNNYVKVLLALEEVGRDVRGKKLSKILNFVVRRYLSILGSNGMTEHTSILKLAISKKGKDYLRKMSITL